MNTSLLVRWFGFPPTLIHGDTLVLDRWLWLRQRLPYTRNGERLIDFGCGSGAFTIGAAKRGYQALGISWDERNQQVAAERARLCRQPETHFEVFDLRRLGERKDWIGQFEVALCLETIEHLLDDQALMRSMSACLKPGGRLLLTTPNLLFRHISRSDSGPYPVVEDGGHVRRGYSPAMLQELCDHAGLQVEHMSMCSGVLSQKITGLFRVLAKIHHLGGWAAVLPLRLIPPLLDGMVTRWCHFPFHTICLEAYKPRFARTKGEG